MARNNRLAAFTLDDFDVRSGSATSILRSIAGLYLRGAPTAVARTQVVRLAIAAGVSQSAAQTSITRLVDRGLLQVEPQGKVFVSKPAQAMFSRGDRRIFSPRQMDDGDQWTLVAYSLPESLRPVRHQLRKYFSQLGGGLVSSGLWIFPHYLNAEVVEVLASLQVRKNATLFVTGEPEFAHSAPVSARAWWDLDKLQELHTDFIAAVSLLDPTSWGEAESYRCYVRLIDAWRAIPYLDPGLPPAMLPSSWPGSQSRELFLSLSDAHRLPAQKYATKLLDLELMHPSP